MAVDWLQVLFAVLWIVAGFFAWYFRTKTNLFNMATEAIAKAESEFADVSKAGNQKMQWATEFLYQYIPAPLKMFITKEIVTKILQSAFDWMKNFAEQQMDKIIQPDE